MATSKRERGEVDDGQENICEKNSSKKFHKSGDSNGDLERFLSWSKCEGLLLSEKVIVSRNGSCAQYGMMAADNIEPGTTLFELPRSMLLSSETTGIAKILQEESQAIQSSSGWVPLLLSLLHEFTDDKSRWSPYLHLVPDFNELDLPMFWNDDTLQSELKGTGVCEAVKKDLQMMKLEFDSLVLPFVKKYSSHFKPICEDFEFYKKMVAFVMAYSFTEPDTDEENDDSDEENDDLAKHKKIPVMVPMADILNHVALNNAHLDFGKDSLKMVSTRRIEKGTEVFNTYGELANWQLLHMYGFAEAFPNNIYDAIDLPMNQVYTALTDGVEQSDCILAEKKWRFLKEIGCVSEGGAYVLGIQGILTETEMYQLLKVMTMNETDFKLHLEKEGWSDAENEDDDSESLTYESITNLPTSWKEILTKITKFMLSKHGTTLDEERKNIADDARLPRRQLFTSYVRYGQLKLLNTLLEACDAHNNKLTL